MTASPPFLVEIRGAGGSGKTTVARRVMARYLDEYREAVLEAPMVLETLKRGRAVWDGGSSLLYADGGALESRFEEAEFGFQKRRSPRVLGVTLDHPAGGRPLFVLGGQGNECAGVDTLPNMDVAYEIARIRLGLGLDVIAEGRIFSMSDLARPLALRDHLLVIALDTSLEECERGTLERRSAAGVVTTPERLQNLRKNLLASHQGAASGARRLALAGAEVHVVDRELAVEIIAERLGVADQPERPAAAPAPAAPGEGQLDIFGGGS